MNCTEFLQHMHCACNTSSNYTTVSVSLLVPHNIVSLIVWSAS